MLGGAEEARDVAGDAVASSPDSPVVAEEYALAVERVRAARENLRGAGLALKIARKELSGAEAERERVDDDVLAVRGGRR